MDKGAEGVVGHSYGTGFLHMREKYFCTPTALCNNRVVFVHVPRRSLRTVARCVPESNISRSLIEKPADPSEKNQVFARLFQWSAPCYPHLSVLFSTTHMVSLTVCDNGCPCWHGDTGCIVSCL